MARPTAPVGAPKHHPGSTEHRASLTALRDRLALAVETCGTRELAPLAGRYQAVLRELATMAETAPVDGLDDLRARRSRRRPEPKTTGPTDTDRSTS